MLKQRFIDAAKKYNWKKDTLSQLNEIAESKRFSSSKVNDDESNVFMMDDIRVALGDISNTVINSSPLSVVDLTTMTDTDDDSPIIMMKRKYDHHKRMATKRMVVSDSDSSLDDLELRPTSSSMNRPNSLNQFEEESTFNHGIHSNIDVSNNDDEYCDVLLVGEENPYSRNDTVDSPRCYSSPSSSLSNRSTNHTHSNTSSSSTSNIIIKTNNNLSLISTDSRRKYTKLSLLDTDFESSGSTEESCSPVILTRRIAGVGRKKKLYRHTTPSSSTSTSPEIRDSPSNNCISPTLPETKSRERVKLRTLSLLSSSSSSGSSSSCSCSSTTSTSSSETTPIGALLHTPSIELHDTTDSKIIDTVDIFNYKSPEYTTTTSSDTTTRSISKWYTPLTTIRKKSIISLTPRNLENGYAEDIRVSLSSTATTNNDKIRKFSSRKIQLTQELYEEFRQTVFQNKLPKQFKIEWCNKLRTTAGVCFSSFAANSSNTRSSAAAASTTTNNNNDDGNTIIGEVSYGNGNTLLASGDDELVEVNYPETVASTSSSSIAGGGNITSRYVSRIKLSSKVVDTEIKLRETLLHEMCHAAAWIIDHCRRPPHGKIFQRYAAKGMEVYPRLNITTCHSYKVHYKWRYQCVKCDHIYGRHSNSIDIKKKACGLCRGSLELLGSFNKEGTKSNRKPSAYNVFVKKHFNNIKKSLPVEASHSDVMVQVSIRWKALNLKN